MIAGGRVFINSSSSCGSRVSPGTSRSVFPRAMAVICPHRSSGHCGWASWAAVDVALGRVPSLQILGNTCRRPLATQDPEEQRGAFADDPHSCPHVGARRCGWRRGSGTSCRSPQGPKGSSVLDQADEAVSELNTSGSWRSTKGDRSDRRPSPLRNRLLFVAQGQAGRLGHVPLRGLRPFCRVPAPFRHEPQVQEPHPAARRLVQDGGGPVTPE